jgi:parallel beta-helix repeat protein
LVKGSTFSSGTKSTGGVFAIGTEDVSDDASRFNLVENCTMYDGEHHVIAIESGQNTIRNNHLQNADGTQRVFVLYGSTNATGIRNIVEGNFIGYANLQTDNSANSGMTLSAAYNIIRYNQFLRNTEAGISLYTSAGYFTVPSYNKIYNNTIFNNSLGGDQDGTGMNFQNDGNAGTIQGNVIKNNLFYQNNGVKNPPWRTYGGVLLANQTFTNNYQDSNGDPLFVNSTGTDPTSTTLPNLNLQSGSPARDFGAALTTVSSGCNTSTLTLADAGYFQDGTFAPSGTISADWVAVGTVGNTKQITAINYSTNVVSFGSTVSCTNGNSVWLYKNSSGTVVLYNTAPDGGAFEYVVGGGDVTPPVCTITSPTTNTTWPTSSATITVGGSATDGVGVTSISWACPTCTPSSGVATCIGCTGQSVTWSQLVALTSGANVFTATATDGVNTHADAITITYTPGVGPAEHSPSDVRGVTLRGVKR